MLIHNFKSQRLYTNIYHTAHSNHKTSQCVSTHYHGYIKIKLPRAISHYVVLYMSRVVRKPAFCIFKPLAIFCGCTARFVSDLVENPEDRFSQNEAHIIIKHKAQQISSLIQSQTSRVNSSHNSCMRPLRLDKILR